MIQYATSKVNEAHGDCCLYDVLERLCYFAFQIYTQSLVFIPPILRLTSTITDVAFLFDT